MENSLFHGWLSNEFTTALEIVFPYGNQYGWGVAHKKKKKLRCNIFVEVNAFTVMIRLTNKQYEAVYGEVLPYMQEYIDNKYPCSDGGWIHYRITCMEHLEDIKKLLDVKCS